MVSELKLLEIRLSGLISTQMDRHKCLILNPIAMKLFSMGHMGVRFGLSVKMVDGLRKVNPLRVVSGFVWGSVMNIMIIPFDS
jgi:hypothetical protein